MIKIVLDTNFLLYCAKYKIDYMQEIENLMTEGYELVTLSQIITELNKIEIDSKKFSERQNASLALKILKHNNIKILEGIKGEGGDEAIINFIKEELKNRTISSNFIATHDLELVKKVKKIARTITIEGGKKIIFG